MSEVLSAQSAGQAFFISSEMAGGTEKEGTTTTTSMQQSNITGNADKVIDNLPTTKNYTSTASISVSYKKNSDTISSQQHNNRAVGSTESLPEEETLVVQVENNEQNALLVHILKCNANSQSAIVPPSPPGSKNRERSKTPPANMTSAATSQAFNDFLLGAQSYMEKSRDSGVHLDCPPDYSGSSSSTSGEKGDEDDSSRRHSKSSSLPHGVKLCPEGSGCVSKEERCANLEDELRKAQIELKAKDAEVEILKGIRQQVEGELEDLTASLFQEAHKMVTEAKMKEVGSEKSLKEAKMQLEGLQAEVAALKALLITSTPSRPNLGGNNSNGISLFKKQHKRTPSHNHLQYGRSNEEEAGAVEKGKQSSEVVIDRAHCDVDPILMAHFAAWRVNPDLTREKSDFLHKIYTEDIDPCLCFADEALVNRLKKAIEDNSVWVEPLPEKDRNNVPKDCALLKSPRVCHYRMRFAFDSDEWFDISQICRDRIASVCEFLNYLRYTKNGLVKASVEDAYWEMLRLRKQMVIAKLGISIS